MRDRRFAFTLLELLVVIAIIGILLAMLLPAVQQVRASAALLQCRTNLKQIALASHSYHDANRVFPPGINVSPYSRDPNPDYNFPAPYAGPYTGCLAYLLPYLEQNNIYNELASSNPGLFQLNSSSPAWGYGHGPFDIDDPNVLPSQRNGTGSGYPKAIDAKIPTYLCPANPGISGTHVFDGMSWNSYPPNLDYLICLDWVPNVPHYGHEWGRSNYIGVGGGFGLVSGNDSTHASFAPYTGIYYGNSSTRIDDITDGTSNTLAFGEFLGGLSRDGTRYGELAWMGSGMLITKYGLAPIYGPSNNDYYVYQFQSSHNGGRLVNFAFADGSVRGVSQQIDYNVFLAASGIRDGVPFSAAALE